MYESIDVVQTFKKMPSPTLSPTDPVPRAYWQAQTDQLLQRVAALEREKSALQAEVAAAKEALHKAAMLERQLGMDLSNSESLVQQKSKTISWCEAMCVCVCVCVF